MRAEISHFFQVTLVSVVRRFFQSKFANRAWKTAWDDVETRLPSLGTHYWIQQPSNSSMPVQPPELAPGTLLPRDLFCTRFLSLSSPLNLSLSLSN